MSLSHSPGIVTNGIVLYLDAANTKSYPGSGTTWFDLSGNSNNFTISGTLTHNTANGFSGFSSSNKIFSSTFKPTNLKQSQGGVGYTTLVWARCTTITGWQKLIGNSDTENYIDLYAGVSNATYRQEDGSSLFYNNNISVTNNSFVLSDSVWRMLGSTNLNGGMQTTPTTNFGIGNEGDATYNYPWSGNIVVVQIYNRILTDAEIKQNFNALRGRFGV